MDCGVPRAGSNKYPMGVPVPLYQVNPEPYHAPKIGSHKACPEANPLIRGTKY